MKCLLLALAFLSFSIKAAPSNPGIYETWEFSFGSLNQRADASLRSTAPGDPPTEIDLEDLGLDSNETAPQMSARWRFAEKWALTAAYSDFSVSSNRSIDKSFNHDGVTYPINGSLSSGFDMGIFLMAVDYGFHQSDNTEWGIGVGLHAMDLGVKFKGNLNGLTLGRSGQDFLAPLPNVRIFTRHAFSPKWMLSANLGWMGADIDKFSGDLLIAGVALDYRISKRWSVAANYQFTDVNLDIDDGVNEDKLDMQLNGFGLMVRYSIP
jgi:hypothetical protein